MLFSIIIPTYNRGHLISKTIESVLSQEFQDFELIVVDDGSTDNTQVVVQNIIHPKLRYYKRENAERGAARNFGASVSNGKYVNFFDSDDILLPNHLSIAVSLLNKHNHPEWFHLGFEVDNISKNKLVRKPLNDSVNKNLILGNVLSCNGVFIRKDIFDNNRFNEDRRIAASEDWELWLRLASQFKLFYDNTVTSIIVNHDERSVLTFKTKSLIQNKTILNTLIESNGLLRNYYGLRNIKRFKASNYSYISLHLSFKGEQLKQVLFFLIKSICLNPFTVFSFRFLSIIKHTLLSFFGHKGAINKDIEMLNPIYIQCKRCVMDTSDVDIYFDDKGYCNHCNDFFNYKKNHTYKGKESDERLVKKVEQIKAINRNSKYDCIVGISGGFDSCYVAYKCQALGLRVLLVHVDNNWNTKTSVENIESISGFLDLDLKTYVLDWESFKECQLSLLKASVPEIETPTDIAILEYLHKAAIEYNVKHIIMGGNFYYEGIMPNSWHYNSKDAYYIKKIVKRFSEKKVRNLPSFSFMRELYCKFFKRVSIEYILNDVKYSKQIALQELKLIGWMSYGEKHHESFFTRIVQSYILPKKFGIDYRKAILSNKICIGEYTRERALSVLQELPYSETTLDSDLNYFCKKLEITRSMLDEILSQKPLDYSFYPNRKKILSFLYKLYWYFKGKKMSEFIFVRQ